MTAAICQRWRSHRSLYRPAGEVIDPRRFEVSDLARPAARSFVAAHHYERTFPANRFRFGLHRGAELVGVAVFSVPCRDSIITKPLGLTDAKDGTELGRFVLLDDVAGNGETWFLARCFERLRKLGIAGVVSHSDPLPRRTSAGAIVMPGHVGTIYQAFNGRYLGRASARLLRLLPNGSVFSERVMSKIRAREKGWEYGVEQLVRAGADRPRAGEDLRDWMWAQLARVARVVRHPGNHRYVWGLHRAITKRLPASLPYPKLREAA